jgi:predicted nucleic acid-binding protein
VVTRILVDTSAILALLDADDPRQELVRAAFEEHADDELVTHGYVVAESLAVARRRLGVDGVIVLLDEVLPAIELLAMDPALHHQAQRDYRASRPSGVSFVDQVSLALMDRESIRTALVLDADFDRQGIDVIPASRQ